MSPEHYRCHVIHVKQTKSDRVSDMVFFKTKYITQPTLTPADVITKALNDLTKALTGKSNEEGIKLMVALKQLETILSNAPEVALAPMDTRLVQQRVTFNEAANAQTELEMRETTPTPRVSKKPK